MRRLYALPENPNDEPLLTVKTFLNSASKPQLKRAEEIACRLWVECYGSHEHWQLVRKVSPVLSHNVYCYPLMWLEENELALLGFEKEEVARSRQIANKLLNTMFSFLKELVTYNWYHYDMVKDLYNDFCNKFSQQQIHAALNQTKPQVRSIGMTLWLALQCIQQEQYLTASNYIQEIQEKEIPEQLRRFI